MISFIHIFQKIKQNQMGRKILFIVSQRFRKCMLVRFLCLVLLIGYAEADQTCAVGTSFCFDDDYMTVPMRDDNQYYIKPDGRPGADFIWFSSMFTTGSSIEKIESRTDGKIIRSIKFTEYPTEQGSATFQVGGNIDTTAGDRITVYLGSDEYLTFLELEGDDDRLCKFYFETNKNNAYNLGAGNCGGSNKGVTKLASGIIVGVFGNADLNNIYMFGLYVMQPIQNVFIQTESIDEGNNTPYFKNVWFDSYDNSEYTVDKQKDVVYNLSTSYSYQNTYQSESFTSLAVSLNAAYKYDKVTTSIKVDGSIDYYWDLSTSTSSSQSGSYSASTAVSTSYCCPAGYKCTYYVNQLYGTLPLSSDLTSKVKNIVELSTRAQFEFYNYPLYYGDSMEATNYQTVIELEPNPYEDEVDKTDPFNSCESSRAEQSSSASKTSALVTPVKYQRFSFTKENALEGSIDLLTSSMKKQIKNRLLLLLKTGERIEGQVDVDALLEPLYSASYLPAGTPVRSTISGNGYVGYSKIV